MNLRSAAPADRASGFPGMLAWALRHWRALAAASWLVSGALYLTLPPSPDQFQHAYLGWRLLEGDALYRDVIDMNWPGVAWLHAIATWLFGNTLWSWRAFDFCLFGACALMLADLARQGAGREAGRFALILCPPAYAGVSYWLAGQHDMTAAQFLVGALWCHVRGYERRAWIWQIGTGLCIGAAMLSKPTAGVIGLLLPVQASILGRPIAEVVRHTAIAGIAAVAALLAALGGVLALGTGWEEVYEAAYLYNVHTQYTGSQTPVDMLERLLHFHFRWIPMVAVGAIPALIGLFRGGAQSLAASAMLILWAAGVASFLLQWRGFAYHLAPCFLALLGMTATSVALAADRRLAARHGARMRVALTTAVVFSIAAIGLKLAVYYRTLPHALVNGNYSLHLERFDAGDEVTFADARALADRLRTAPQPGCTLLVGDVTSLNYLSMRPMPTRFYYYHVLANVSPATPLARRWIARWERDLISSNCHFVVIARSVSRDWLKSGHPAAAVLRRLLTRYRMTDEIGRTGGLLLFERL